MSATYPGEVRTLRASANALVRADWRAAGVYAVILLGGTEDGAIAVVVVPPDPLDLPAAGVFALAVLVGALAAPPPAARLCGCRGGGVCIC